LPKAKAQLHFCGLDVGVRKANHDNAATQFILLGTSPRRMAIKTQQSWYLEVNALAHLAADDTEQ
jgi:hypothetical protein